MKIYPKVIKPVLDFVIAALLLVVTSPVLVMTVIFLTFANGCDGAFFLQPRPGKGGKIFKIIKFKTMNDRRDNAGNWTSGRLSGRNCYYYLNSSFGWTNSVTAANGEDARRLDMYQQSSFGAWYARLSRNRNLDGDGNINYDVVRWYLPAIEEYFLISLGENAISNESRLYFGDKSAMTYDGYPNSYLADGAIYYSRSHMLL